MRKAVSLAYESITKPSAFTSTPSSPSSSSSASAAATTGNNNSNSSTKGKERVIRDKPAVVLALSCYGAILSPGQEYSGRYPPPYGHPSHSTSNSSAISSPSSTLCSALKANNQMNWMQEAEKALEEWHYDRLKVFASHSETWDKISYIAFETLPVPYEARAVRRAMTRLRHAYSHANQSSTSTFPSAYSDARDGRHREGEPNNTWPKWWISFVFPNDGNLPYKTSLESASPITPETIAETIFKPMRMAFSSSQNQEEVDVEIPTGLGVNCTKMRYLPGIVDAFTRSTTSIPSDASQNKQKNKERWLVLYPDGGLVYDPVTKTWHQDGGEGSPTPEKSPAAEKGTCSESDSPAKMWAQQLVDIARKANGKDGVWDKIILGGCCKASPAYISELANLVNAEKQQ
jgi:homocysteine S-methyltransferase